MTTGPEDQPHRTTAELADACGLTTSEVRRLWWALGLPDAGDDAVWTEEDLAALRGLRATGLGADTMTRLARAIGQGVGRIADWQVAAVVSDRHGDAAAVLRDARPALESLVAVAWRRHLEIGLARFEAEVEHSRLVHEHADATGDDPGGVPDAPEHEQSLDLTVGFVDMVNFSGLSATLDVHRIGDLVEVFEARAADVVAAHDGRLVKTIGDAVLFVTEDAAAGARIAFDLVEVIGRDARLPDVRLGLASGPVVSRLGDVFGAPVNLASRLTALARRNRVLTEERTVARLPRTGFAVRRLTARPVRGFGLVEPIALGRA